MGNRPQIKIAPSRLERYLDLLSLVAVIASLLYVIRLYSELPAEVPTHFNLAGEPDDYGSKSTLLLLPIIGLVVVLALHFAKRHPHLFNYGVPITPDNAEEQYKQGIRLMRWVQLLTALLFAYLSFGAVQVALGKSEGLNNAVMWILFGLILAIPLLQLFKGRSKG